MTIAAAINSETARRTRCCEALSDPGSLHSLTGTLDAIAVSTGRLTALKHLAEMPAAERRDHAIRLLCAATARRATNNDAIALAAEIEVYADAASGRMDLT